MKTHLSLTQMAAELERQQNTKRDFIADTGKLQVIANLAENKLNLEIDTTKGADEPLKFELNDIAHRQISSNLKIPATYYDTMREKAPLLLAHNVNHWFHREPQKRLVRTLDGSARAFLSDRYRRLDNFDLAEVVLPLLGEMPDVRFESIGLTDKRLYIKAVLPRIQGEVKRGDVVQSGVVISNSEVGEGSVSVQPLVFRLACLNGMVVNIGQRKYHVGRQNAVDGAEELLSDEALRADDKAFWLKVRDVVRATASDVGFGKILERLRESTEQKIEAEVTELVERTQKRFSLSEREGKSLLTHLASGGDLTAYGLIQAVTATAQEDYLTYDRASELEKLGGDILELPRSEWKVLAAA